MQILIYDDKGMRVHKVSDYAPNPVNYAELDITKLDDMERKIAFIPDMEYTAVIQTKEVIAELDPTTMKRIAEYNLNKELEGLNRRIECVKVELGRLEGEMDDRKRKIDFIDEMFQRIWDDDYFNEEKYAPKDDYEEDY